MTNEIYLFGEVDTKMAAAVVGRFGKVKTLTAYLMTEGGDFGSALAIYDEIRKIPDSTVIATGIVASSGATILQAFSNRKARLNTHFVVHPGGVVNIESLEEKIKQEKYFNDVQFDVLSRSMGISNTRMAFGYGSFGVERAFKLNMIDAVVE